MSLTDLSEKSHIMSDNTAQAPHQVGFNANPKTINWERLEFLRLKKLNLGPERYSRHFQRFQPTNDQRGSQDSAVFTGTPQFVIGADGEIKLSNSLAPFTTVEKPTCGFFFSRVTDNKKKKFGIPPTNLVKWRSFVQ